MRVPTVLKILLNNHGFGVAQAVSHCYSVLGHHS
jgi:hypothetical protein